MTALLVTVGELLIYTQLAAKIVPLQSGVSLTHVPFHVPTLTTQILANVISVYVNPHPSRPGLSFRLSSHLQFIRIPTYPHTQYQHYLHAANSHLVPEHKLIPHTGMFASCLRPSHPIRSWEQVPRILHPRSLRLLAFFRQWTLC